MHYFLSILILSFLHTDRHIFNLGFLEILLKSNKWPPAAFRKVLVQIRAIIRPIERGEFYSLFYTYFAWF
jgi:hypothetical protein